MPYITTMKQKQVAGKQALEADDFEKMFMPGLAIDTVIFGFHENQLKILLLEYENTNLFALPGGFIKKDENLADAARRTLSDRTSLENIYLEQFYIFGDIARHDPKPLRTIMQGKGLGELKDHWLFERFLTVGFYALIDYTKAVPIPDLLSDRCEWHELENLPRLILDHKQIVDKALETLRTNLDEKLIAFNLMPEHFTMADLQSLYETVLGEKLLRTSFQRKMLNMEILERIEKKYTGGAHKAPYLYKFAKKQQ
ncbi:MAG: hydrolase [Segetibacter sp.]|nr:hydrolase [Segetibacter sp.]